MKSTKSTIGSVFAVHINDNKKFFQFVARDLSQLGSDVIRVFKRDFPRESSPSLDTIVSGEVDFYAHVVIRWGIDRNLWQKVGTIKNVGTLDVLFRDCRELGNLTTNKSTKWFVWKINEPFRDIGRLDKQFQHAEIGIVVTPDDVVYRMRFGKYGFVYPTY